MDRGFGGVHRSKKEQDKVLGSLRVPAQLTSPRNADRWEFYLGSERESESYFWDQNIKKSHIQAMISDVMNGIDVE